MRVYAAGPAVPGGGGGGGSGGTNGGRFGGDNGGLGGVTIFNRCAFVMGDIDMNGSCILNINSDSPVFWSSG